TGGHLFPALALAEELARQAPEAEIVFVGSPRGLENRVVPAHGYRLEVLDVEGLKKRRG
ncbi:MAG: UDP-N-acetylglucosamine--N-acetylmuramyl-(pentapeptide) pyrophosphoryl-undecaprenol N-acetylglucosamine transferase, partial [Thermoplasmata archaeon]|nr:UDP-N-acetylglucosamine--N-acetylmuramyl-(pentapeptide) pyrophosphoryl-undecaprenol N-acetylglucosamine transferase [Thermoplasmata archaeon]NIT77159.1 UDP-N-acetylglucosamine--N-acetylmuramyl-(pentapeptide) pyrophosphoryl-undecaprenol N-acetylglucosamine transferase [Thermoplasmata archaeon]NIU49994.1 UDP-N-acetylglucosamine--N-acetylmuramyl-(pentapeptide) pyrophosphoryl-undecaprenol N-acetylglucosamine transferase [Thermoplasmata archaeon]NIV78627.1 UDP-N-acetylglucosamine--N-acetylmuramyl-